MNHPICKLYPLEIRANEKIEKDEIITDETIVDNDTTSSYELNQRPNSFVHGPTLSLFLFFETKKKGVC